MKRRKTKIVSGILLACLILLMSGCGTKPQPIEQMPKTESPEVQQESLSAEDAEPAESPAVSEDSYASFDWNSIPEYSGQAVIPIHGDEPMFTEEEKSVYQGTFLKLSELDSLGRCGAAYACVGQETEPSEDRGDISSVKPSGWNQLQLSDGSYLYNRSHLIMYALSGLNDDPRNLITGTRQFNADTSGKGMLSYETTVKWVVDNRNGHVLYRVTPVYDGDNLVAKGVLMEAYCIEYPEDCEFCVFVYNVQDGISINYATGEAAETNIAVSETQAAESAEEKDYVLNTNSHKFHLADCVSVADMEEHNKETRRSTRTQLIAEGYEPCGRCKP